jgi:hypothetical protein
MAAIVSLDCTHLSLDEGDNLAYNGQTFMAR